MRRHVVYDEGMLGSEVLFLENVWLRQVERARNDRIRAEVQRIRSLPDDVVDMIMSRAYPTIVATSLRHGFPAVFARFESGTQWEVEYETRI